MPKRLTPEEFITKAIKAHGNKYDYSKVNYINSRTKIEIICPRHGSFFQNPHDHVDHLHNCPICVKYKFHSKDEDEIYQYIKSFYDKKILQNDRKQIAPYELDIYLPDYKLGIEVNGIYWHKLRERKAPGLHKLKYKLAKKAGIKLINITEKDWKKKQDKIKDFLRNKINESINKKESKQYGTSNDF